MDGYTGKFLNLNLNNGTGKDFVMPEEEIQKYLGGRGFGVWLLFNGLEPHVDPLSPENTIIVATGPLAGLGIPSVNNTVICTKSPLTGTISCASISGDFGGKLKSCGYDGLIIRGRSPRPVVVDITEGKWKFREAESLWGQNVARTIELLDSDVASTICIGPAGENMVRFASIASGEHTAQRGGAGAVMGSKLLKAVRVGGAVEPSVFDRERLQKPVDRLKARLRESTETYPRYGTAGNIDRAHYAGSLPARNFSQNSFERYLKINGESLRAGIRRKGLGCPHCTVECSTEMKLQTRSGAVRIKGPGYQGLSMLGSNLLIDDLDSIIRNNYLCYLLGMDPVSMGGTLAVAMDLAEKGKIDLPLHYGSAKEVGPLLPLVAKRHGQGNELADGAMRLASRYGYLDHAMTVKGMEIPGYDPRGAWGQALAYATCPHGGSHIGSMLAAVEIAGQPAPIPGPSAAGKPRLLVQAQNMFCALDCMVACQLATFSTIRPSSLAEMLPTPVIAFLAGRLPSLAFSMLDFSDYCQAVSFVTGVKYDRAAVMTVGERVFNLERLFNIREGLTSKDDQLPLRFVGEPFLEGALAGKVVPFPRMLQRYYDLRGWNEVGIPSERQLQKLSIQ